MRTFIFILMLAGVVAALGISISSASGVEHRATVEDQIVALRDFDHVPGICAGNILPAPTGSDCLIACARRALYCNDCCTNTFCDPCAGQPCLDDDCETCENPIFSGEECNDCNEQCTINVALCINQCVLNHR